MMEGGMRGVFVTGTDTGVGEDGGRGRFCVGDAFARRGCRGDEAVRVRAGAGTQSF